MIKKKLNENMEESYLDEMQKKNLAMHWIDEDRHKVRCKLMVHEEDT